MRIGKTSVANYAYACTRVRARKKFLIKSDEYTRLMSMDLASVARYIGESQYKFEIEKLSASYSGTELIEMATYLNLASTYEQVMRFCKGEARDVLERYLSEIDLKNLKTIIRGKFHGASDVEIKRDLIPGGRFTGKLGDVLINKKEIAEIIEALKGTVYHKPLAMAYDRDPTLKMLTHLEDALDITYYSHLINTLKGRGTSTTLFKDFIAREIDMKNLITLLQVKNEEENGESMGLDPIDIFIPGGKELSVDILRGLMASQDLKQLFGMLERYSFYEAMSPEIDGTLSSGSLNDICNAIEKNHLSRVARFASRYPLSILPIVHYLILKKEEVDNLRIIARGKERGLTSDMIKKLVIS